MVSIVSMIHLVSLFEAIKEVFGASCFPLFPFVFLCVLFLFPGDECARTGQDRKGQERIGQDRIGQDRTG